MRLHLVFGVDKGRIEKMILPTILYVNANDEAMGEFKQKGFFICFVLWDFEIKLVILI